MIAAVSWFCAEDHGVIVPAGSRWKKPSPAPDASAEIMALIDRPVKYYGRLTDDARLSMCAGALALRASGWKDSEIGVISAGFDATLNANRNYFRDYVACGRTLGRGNLFIYTLPTSAPGEVAIALSLSGPCLFLETDTKPLGQLIHHAEQLTADGEADGMLALWGDGRIAICLAIDGKNGDQSEFQFLNDAGLSPPELVLKLRAMVR